MTRRTGAATLAAVAGMAAAALWWWMTPGALAPAEIIARIAAQPARAVAGPVYHLGHSLVGRDMPAMLAQLTGMEHHSQLGWGATLQQHWKGGLQGFETENAHPAHRPAEAIDGGGYDAVVLTEMVELTAAIRWHDAPDWLAAWAARAAEANPQGQVFLYETWHHTDDPAGWEARIAADRTALWKGVLLANAMAQPDVPPLRVIPGGPALAAVAAAAADGRLPGLPDRAAFFSDTIHLNDTGHYVIALVHYAVLTGRSPEGLPYALTRDDGSAMAPIDPAAAAEMQRIVWAVVTADPLTGLAR